VPDRNYEVLFRLAQAPVARFVIVDSEVVVSSRTRRGPLAISEPLSEASVKVETSQRYFEFAPAPANTKTFTPYSCARRSSDGTRSPRVLSSSSTQRFHSMSQV
jgi:hypothetical protein